MTATIRNDFHETWATVRVAEDGKLSPSQIKRIRNALCGIKGCTCGGNLSERGRQEVMIDVYGHDDIRISTMDESCR